MANDAIIEGTASRTQLPAKLTAKPEGGRPLIDRAALARSIRGPAWLGSIFTLVFLGGFVAWGATAPLAGGAVAPGIISPDGSRRTVQHLEGGIIGELLVKEHDTVQAGAPLLVLEETQARAAYQMQRGQFRTAQATLARLVAEQGGKPAIDFPADLLAERGTGDTDDIIRGQQLLFESRGASHLARKKVLRQRIEQLREQTVGIEAQVVSDSEQLAIIADELEGKEGLLRKGLSSKPEVLALKRRQAEIGGNRGEHLAQIARTKQQIGETELQLVAVDAERADEVAKQTDEVRAQLAEVGERINASRDVLRRTVITAPVSGRIVNLAFKTTGGVVKPGEPIMDIVPLQDDLLIDARVAPNDIDVVHPGQLATVHLPAFSARLLPRIEGEVRSVSADRLTDSQTGQPYYMARVQIDRAQIEALGPDILLVPGMAAEVLIVKGERTMLHYLMEPFTDVFRFSFREM